jgi:hypothetical protein
MARTLRNPLDLREATRLYESGLTLRQVAHRVGWSYGGLHSRFAEAGVTMRPRGGCVSPHRLIRARLGDRVAEVVVRARQGERVADLAHEVRVSPTSLYRLLAEEGVHVPKPRKKVV